MDPSQNGKYAAPVMTLAKKIGIPVVLVDIRMEASHQELPSLELLRHGSERALQGRLGGGALANHPFSRKRARSSTSGGRRDW